MSQPVLTMKGIYKEFPGVTALDDVDFELYPGEVHGLVGENGAGKSTLMKILSGVYQPTRGKLSLKGKETSFNNPLEAQKLGISIIHQEFNLFPNLSVAENIFINHEGMTTSLGKVNWSKIYDDAKELIHSLGSDIDVKQQVQYLSVHSQQVVEIAKAISFEADILIMDEPTAALPENEVDKMFKVIEELKKQGVAIVYISHRLKEIFEITNKVTVLRDGYKVATKKTEDTNQDELISMMVGKEVGNLYPDAKKSVTNSNTLSVKELALDESHKVSFDLNKGEVLGLFGLMGSGTRTVAERLFGLREGDGRIIMNGEEIKINTPKDAMKHNISYIPSDRKQEGLVVEMNVKENISLPILERISQNLLVKEKNEEQISQEYIEKLNIKTPDQEQIVNFLSGGNQQKVVLAKWLAIKPKVLIMEEPTRGVDVGAKAEIYELIHELADQGLSILLISSEMPEVIGMSDRILVMHQGKIVEEFSKGEANQQLLLKKASNS